jgi:SAM-dependent methyltransferase
LTLEITKDIVEQLKIEGLNVHMKTLAEFAETGQRFDWVVCLNLIEHLSDPLAGIEQLASLVKDKGMLAIETPNGDAVEEYGKNAYGLHVDKEHLNYFKPDQLINLFKERNFSLVCKKYYPLGARTGRAKISGDFTAGKEMNLEQTYRTDNVSKGKARTLLDKIPPNLRGCLRSIVQSARYIVSLDEILTGKAFEYIIIMKRN